MTNIIINADDLGLNSIVNNKIESFIKEGLITSTTMMANGEVVEDAIRIAKKYPKISFGVHLCLDEYISITKSDILKSCGIVDKDYVFTRSGIYKIKKPTIEVKDAIYDELIAQIKIFNDAGIKISHIDSHHHCHTRSLWILEIIIDLANKYDIKVIRRPSSNRIKLRNQNYEMSIKDDLSNNKIKEIGLKCKTFLLVSARALFNLIWISKANKKLRTANKFYSYYTLCHYISKLKPEIQNKTIELMCHPGHPDYETETHLIKNRLLDNLIECNYISYNELI